jgi:hypothetical protein
MSSLLHWEVAAGRARELDRLQARPQRREPFTRFAARRRQAQGADGALKRTPLPAQAPPAGSP